MWARRTLRPAAAPTTSQVTPKTKAIVRTGWDWFNSGESLTHREIDWTQLGLD